MRLGGWRLAAEVTDLKTYVDKILESQGKGVDMIVDLRKRLRKAEERIKELEDGPD